MTQNNPAAQPNQAAELEMLMEDPATAVNAHLSSKATSLNYLRFADEVKQ